MSRRFFSNRGLSLAVGTTMLLCPAATHARDGLFRSRANNSAMIDSNATASSTVNSTAKQSQSSSSSGAVMTSSSGKSLSNMRSVPFSRSKKFITQSQSSGSNVIAAPNGNTGITGMGLPKSRKNGRLMTASNQFVKANKVIAAPNGNTGITGAGLPKSKKSSGIAMFRDVIAASNGNTGVTGSGLPKSRKNSGLVTSSNAIAKANKIIAAPNGNTGITGAGLPQSMGNGRVVTAPNGMAKATQQFKAGHSNGGYKSSGSPQSGGQSGIAMFRDVPTATSPSFQTTRNKLAGGVPMQQTQQGLLGEIGGALSEGAKKIGNAVQDAATSIGGPFTSEVTGTGPPSPPAPTSGNNKVALKPVGTGQDPSTIPSRLEGKNKVALKPVGTGKDPSTIPSRREGAIDFGFETKPGPIGNGTPSTPAPNPNPGGPVGNGTPSTPAPNPNPGGPVGNGTPSMPNPNPYPGNQYPGRFPRFPLPYPSGPVVISQPSPVIVNQPAPVIEATEAPVVETITEADVPATVTTLEASSADLVLEDIHLAEGATLIAGPSYRLKFRNQGTAPASKFQVALLAALDVQLTNKAPRALVEVPGLAAGESTEVILRLPKSAMRLASTTTGQLGEFTHLYLAVDFQNTVAELDETNNVADLERLAVDAADQAAMQQ